MERRWSKKRKKQVVVFSRGLTTWKGEGGAGGGGGGIAVVRGFGANRSLFFVNYYIIHCHSFILVLPSQCFPVYFQ